MIAEFVQVNIGCDVKGCNTTLAQEPCFAAARTSARESGHFVETGAVDEDSRKKLLRRKAND